ncbi:MAG: hypothetical protein KJ667_02355 [Alphaproteobacteria bacterium]|nr:hypothetical protein [Alphaproteobacteria bacterium]
MRTVFRQLLHKIIPALRPVSEADIIVTFDDDTIIVTRPNGTTERLRWDALEAVILEIAEGGPLRADMFWILAGHDGTGCLYPGGATGENEMLEALQKRLPGFNDDILIEAMTTTTQQEFLLWTRRGD